MFLGHQSKMVKEEKFHNAEKVEAEVIANSGKWELGKIRSHDQYFTEYVVYMVSGKKVTLPTAQIRHLQQHKIDENATTEEREREFYKILGCDDIEKVPPPHPPPSSPTPRL